jgi:hypothetical protein
MVATNDDITFWMSGGAGNGDPSLSIGGAMSTVFIGRIQSGRLANLWDDVPKSEADSGLTEEYRCIYIKNVNIADTIKQLRLFFESVNADQDVMITIGLDPGGKNSTPSTLANESTTPTGVVFSRPLNYNGGLIIGKLKPGEFYPIWIKRSINAGAIAYWADAYVLRVEGFPITGKIIDWGFSTAAQFGCKSSAAKSNIKHMANRLKDSVPLQLFLAVGDMAHAHTPNCWFPLTKSIDSVTKIVFADSDQDNIMGLLNHYGIAAQYYSFDVQNIHFLVMSTEIAYDINSPQYGFVSNDLSISSLRADIDWIIVSYSQPFYTAGGLGDSAPFVGATFRDIYHPIFDKYLVDLVIQGHNRNYQRTFPLSYNSGSPANPTITDLANNNYTDPVGEIFTIVGTGGYALDSATILSAPAYLAKSNTVDFGYLWLVFSLQNTVLTGTFYDVNNISKDSFSITRTDVEN